MTNEIIAKLKQAANDLLMISESEYPFEVFSWDGQAQEDLTNEKLLELTRHPPDTSIATVDIDDFFRNCAQEKEWHDETQKENVHKFQLLVKTLKENLTNIQVYRLGAVNIDVYLIGATSSGDLAGISTKLVET